MRVRRRSLLAAAVAVLPMLGLPSEMAAAQPAAAQLEPVPSSQLQHLYVAPGADFSRVTGVILDPTQVSFRNNWVRDFNVRSSGRLTERRAEQIRRDASTGVDTVFADAFRNAGFRVVQTPGPGVVRLQAHVVNLAITAPGVVTAGRSRTYARDAGEATLVLEVRDPRTNALLGRATDRRIAGRSQLALRNSVTNRSDFRRVFQHWARSSVEDFRALQATAPSRHPPPG